MSDEAAIDALEDSFQRTPRCAVHADRDARRTPCARCGSYACEACFERADETLCRPCRERIGETLPWERDEGGVLTRYWATLVHVLPAPHASFQGIREGNGLVSALVFAALSNVVSYGLPMLLCAPCSLGALALVGTSPNRHEEVPMSVLLAATACVMFAIPPFVAAVQIVASLVMGLLYHGAASLAGRP